VSSLVFLALRVVYEALPVSGGLPVDDEIIQSVLSTIPPGVYYAASGMEFIEVGETGGRVVLRKGTCARTYHDTDRLLTETWCVDGKEHRADGPSYQRWDAAGRLREEVWRVGKEHRVDGPSYRWWDDAGRLRQEKWCVAGKEHRVGEPSFRTWDAAGRLCEERWRVDGLPVDPPACCRK